jgi:NADH-quinone oxidoreductase subunit H
MDGLVIYDTYLLVATYLIFFTLANLCLVATGVTSGNKYTVLAAGRCANMMFLAELILAIFTSYLFFCASGLDIGNLDVSSEYRNLISTFALIIPIFLQALLAETGRAPYDLVESESEMVMGYSSEYSGFYFAGFILVEYLFMFLLISMLPLFTNV